ncbi:MULTISPECIES: hypothetical protein [Luteibacter]|uniref:hypothetical protein n=1 Tax=Luteibacter sp. dw_328 TaxID=2719796 RepID=UPI000B2EBDDF|nr:MULTISPECIES: hypothetical protein [Luteibacter]
MITESDIAEIRSLFLRQAAAENAHDIDAMGAVLARAEPPEGWRISAIIPVPAQ